MTLSKTDLDAIKGRLEKELRRFQHLDAEITEFGTGTFQRDVADCLKHITELRGALIAAHDALDAICMAGHMHLVSAVLPPSYGLDTFRRLLGEETPK